MPIDRDASDQAKMHGRMRFAIENTIRKQALWVSALLEPCSICKAGEIPQVGESADQSGYLGVAI
jgi:hypothetical protein